MKYIKFFFQFPTMAEKLKLQLWDWYVIFKIIFIVWFILLYFFYLILKLNKLSLTKILIGTCQQHNR